MRVSKKRVCGASCGARDGWCLEGPICRYSRMRSVPSATPSLANRATWLTFFPSFSLRFSFHPTPLISSSTYVRGQQQSSSPAYICNLAEVVDVQRVDLKPFCVELETKEKLLYFAFRTDEEVYGWMEDIYSRSPLMGVSQPTNFVHQVHVGFDPISGGFTVSVWVHSSGSQLTIRVYQRPGQSF